MAVQLIAMGGGACGAFAACRQPVGSSQPAALHVAPVSNCGGRHPRNLPWHASLRIKPFQTRDFTYHSRPVGVVARATLGGSSGLNPIGEHLVHVGEHFLDGFSHFLCNRFGTTLGRYLPANFDPLDWLPPELHSQLHMLEAIAILFVREALLLATFYFMYGRVHHVCRWLYRISTFKNGGRQEFEDSAFEAARAPLRSLIVIWASTRLVQVVARLLKMQQHSGHDLINKSRGIGVVVTVTWFFFRWKNIHVADLIAQHKTDAAQIMAIDKVVELVMYALAASCIAEVAGIALRSLLALGGVSGLAVGLAAKEVVGNFFGGAVIFITRPFGIGEKIKAGSLSGRVVDIGYMQTKLMGFDGNPFLVPNQAFTNQVITNLSRAKSKVLEAQFQLNNQNVFLVDKITEAVTLYLHSHPSVEMETVTPMCYLKTMGSAGPELALSCVIKSSGGAVFYRIQQQILVQVAQIIVDVLGPDAPYSLPPKVSSPSVKAESAPSASD